MTDEDRPSALLTPRQREILQTTGDLSDRGQRAAHSRIRERVYHGFLDFVLIFEELDGSDLERLVERDDEEALDAVVSALAFFHDVAEQNDWDITELVERAAEECYTHERSGRRIVEEANYLLEFGEQDLAETARRVERKHERGAVASLTDREIRVATLLDMRGILDDWKAALQEQHFEDREDETIEKLERRLEMLGKENPNVTALSDLQSNDE